MQKLSLAFLLALAATAHALAPDSQLIPCGQTDTVKITANSHLDPSCTYTVGMKITKSNVTLDCQGAHLVTTDARYGVLITASTDEDLANITVRNCFVQGFLNNFHIERDGFKALPADAQYDHGYANVLIEDSTSMDSRGVGIFVDGYVTGVTLRNLHVEGAGSTGIYLEAGSKDNVVEHSQIVNNGFKENGPNGQFFSFAGTSFFFWGTGREGLAIDGSRFNRLTDNYFSGNSAGSIFLYKNCGEFVHQRPDRWWHRYYGADGNLIEGNTFDGGETGVWIGSRMGENTTPMDCSDPQYAPGFALDYAADNTVHANVFQNVTYGVRVEDDRATITDNAFSGNQAYQQAVLIGTPQRTAVLGQPVDGTTITGNTASIPGNKNPYRWVHDHTATTFENNRSLGERVVGFCEGVPPRRNALIFVLAVVQADPPTPPAGGPPVFPPPAVLPPCTTSCAQPAAIERSRILIQHADTPPGDDTLQFEGRIAVPQPFDPALDPVAAGVGLVLSDVANVRLLDVLIPGGAFDDASHVGWRTSRRGDAWKYVDRRLAPTAGITTIAIKDLSRHTPGLVQFKVRARRGAFPVTPAQLPLTGLLVLDPPTAETGQCSAATFDGSTGTCTASRGTVRCR